MAQIVTTLTKPNDADPWVLSTDALRAQWFTPDEIANTLEPYTALSKSQPGNDTAAYTEAFAGNVFTSTRVFDTLEHATAAQVVMNNQTNPVITTRNTLVRARAAQYNVAYTVQQTVQP